MRQHFPAGVKLVGASVWVLRLRPIPMTPLQPHSNGWLRIGHTSCFHKDIICQCTDKFLAEDVKHAFVKINPSSILPLEGRFAML